MNAPRFSFRPDCLCGLLILSCLTSVGTTETVDVLQDAARIGRQTDPAFEQAWEALVQPEVASDLQVPVPCPDENEADDLACDADPGWLDLDAGYDHGFYLGTADGNFKLRLLGLLQTRYYSNWRDIDASVGDRLEAGFVLERASLIFTGNVLNPQLQYWFVLNGERSSGTRFVEEARISYAFSDALLMQIGRLRNPAFLRELDISYTRQLGIDRSYYHSVFSTGVLEGITLTGQTPQFRLIGFLSDGRHSGSVSRTKDFFQDQTDFALTVGGDWKLFGEWAQYGDFASWADEGPALFAGLSMHYEHGETHDVLGVDEDFISWTADLTYENAGFMAFVSTVGRHAQQSSGNIDQTGVMMMSSYQVVPEKFEPYVRYEYVDFDGVINTGALALPVSDSSLNVLSLGINWYFARHACKWTTEVLHSFDPVPFTSANTGLLVDQAGRNGQTVLGTQLQLFF
ncbi:hypothetical protein [Crateriforma spongiae]|uniref:hypothetical protein n=1 Tax=Crateriforma spongiae TaxID=2724528 RepID=UPI0039B1114D